MVRSGGAGRKGAGRNALTAVSASGLGALPMTRKALRHSSCSDLRKTDASARGTHKRPALARLPGRARGARDPTCAWVALSVRRPRWQAGGAVDGLRERAHTPDDRCDEIGESLGTRSGTASLPALDFRELDFVQKFGYFNFVSCRAFHTYSISSSDHASPPDDTYSFFQHITHSI